jgi:hypothetical protein
MKRALSFGVAFAIVLAASVQAQSDDSLRARARAQGGEATGTLIVDFSAPSVPELTRKAQVIVHGRVVSLQTYLTADESMVMTDVTIAPTRLLKQTIPVSQRAQPGPLRPIIVRHVGGTVVEGALKMTTGVNMFPGDEEFVAGEDVICFLVYDEPAGVFQFADGPFAAFRVREGQVHSLNREAARLSGPRESSAVAAFLADVDRQLVIRYPRRRDRMHESGGHNSRHFSS